VAGLRCSPVYFKFTSCGKFWVIGHLFQLEKYMEEYGEHVV
jgi:hypothetical protein